MAQCRTDLLLGQNMVVNGDFSQGYTSWTFTPDSDGDIQNTGPDGYQIYTGSPRNYSIPGNIYVGKGSDMYGFNNSFNKPFNGHTTGAANDNFLMVDGVCVTGIKLFRETNISIVPNTRYFFTVWINSLKDQPNYPGILNFDVNGTNLATGIVAPALGGGSAGGAWVRVTAFWDSGPTPPATATISIEGNQTIGCGGNSGESDFAIDDISFIPGCSYGDPGPQPDLGPDQSLCGKGGSITLNANVPHLASTTVTWNDGTTGTGLTAPYTKVITTPGTYSVCVVDGSSCIKSDVIVITNTYSINIGGPYVFCSTTSQTLDAGYTGIGVTYLWSKNGSALPYPNTNQTYTATSAGTYKVDVNVPGCGTQSSTAVITSTATVTPIDAYYCATGGAVSGVTLKASGTGSSAYTWFTAATGGTSIATGASYVITPAIPMGSTATYTYYVQDNTATPGTAGTTTYSTSGLNYGSGQMAFNITGDVTINSLQIPFISNYSPAGGFPGFTVTIEVTKSDGSSFSPAQTFVSNTSLETVPGNDGGKIHLYTFPFSSFTISSLLGTSLRLKLTANTHGNGAPQLNQSGFTYPIASSPAGPISITNSYSDATTIDPDGYSYFYNWNISSKYACSRTPVRAINNCPQPVTWTAFYLVPQGNSCKVVWGTANETGNKYFTVERSSDGVNFEVIETVTGAGTRDAASNYYYIDNAPLSGVSYYRITQHDFDGKFTSTSMRAYAADGLTQVTLYPNPFVQGTTLLVTGADALPYSYTIYTVSGQLVETGTGSFNQEKTIAEGLAKGMYMVTVSSNTDIITTKIVKQ